MNPNDIILENPLPSSPESEQALFAGVMIDNNRMKELKDLKVAEIYSPYHKLIYRAMISLWDKKEKIDAITIAEELKTHKYNPDTFGGVARIAQLQIGIPHLDSRSVKKYIQTIKDKAIRRNIVKLCTQITSDALREEGETRDFIEHSSNLVKELTKTYLRGSEGTKGFHTAKDMKEEFHARMYKFFMNQSDSVPTGMSRLDRMLDGGGLQRKGVYFVGAGPKAGKTSLVMDWVDAIDLNNTYRTLVISEEMHKLSLVQRALTKRTNIPYAKFRPGMSKTEFEMIIREFDLFADGSNIHFADDLYSMTDIWDYCEEEINDESKKPVGAIVLDYLQLIKLNNSGDYSDRQGEVSSVTIQSKRMATQLNVPVIAISTLNRDQAKENRRPTKFDFGWSSQIEYAAEAVMLLYNPAYVFGQKYDRPEIEDIILILDAQRNGPTGDIPLRMTGKTMTFVQADDGTDMEDVPEIVDEDVSQFWIDDGSSIKYAD